ncbi:hypothetical protein [Trinickia dinghuensis]|uniref:Phage tail protein n=1 Tax=Trinickia dinghuensis TaxID=2291023 RepID=A0A3D8K262_9BURK|nr:hypothetical protein [Trinickia dinghuensis]RDU99240.1 hypothetical protein DWV00_08960 [Trinickia dinghuensis]
MYQTDQPTAASALPTPSPAEAQGYFTGGNPVTGLAATVVDADFLNMVMMELINVVTASGQTPSKTTYNQVALAIKRLVQSQVVLTDTGVADTYSATNNPPLTAGTWTNGVVQKIAVAHTNNGPSTYAPDGLAGIPIYGLGLQALQGNEMFAGGIASLVKQTIAGVNGGNPICVLLECAGGGQQVPPATASQHAVQMSQAAGIVGSMRNARMSVNGAAAAATFLADEIIVQTALGGVRYCLPLFNQTANLGASGVGGMDTGTAPASGYVALYAIYNPQAALFTGSIAGTTLTVSSVGAGAIAVGQYVQGASPGTTITALGTGTGGAGTYTVSISQAVASGSFATGAAALLATNATTAAAPNVYGGANMPAGYTASALVSVWPTNASKQFMAGTQRDRKIEFPSVLALSTSTSAASFTLFGTSTVPPNAVEAAGNIEAISSVNSGMSLSIASDANGSGQKEASGYVTAPYGLIGPWRCLITQSQSLYYETTNSAGTPTFSVTTSEYSF